MKYANVFQKIKTKNTHYNQKTKRNVDMVFKEIKRIQQG